MHVVKTFDTLYHQLSHAWNAHQALRRSHASLPELADSYRRLDEARLAMRDWHSRHPQEIR